MCGAVSLASYALLTILSFASISHGLRMWTLLFVMVVTTIGPVWLMSTRASLVARPEESRLALRYAIAFGVLCAFVVPFFAADLWYYVAEGRFAAGGGNAYTQHLNEAAVDGLAVEAPRALMPYGPAWVWISAALSSVTAPRVALEFVAYKAVMFLAWLTTLQLVYRAQRASPASQFRSVLILGWLPFPLVAAVAEAHNDIVMVALMTFWIVSGTAASAVPLTASTLVKYTSTPLVALAFVDAVLRRSTKTVLSLCAGTAAVLLVVLIYWQDGALIGALRGNMEGSLYSPVALIEGLVRSRGFPAGLGTVIKAAIRVALIGLVGWFFWRHCQALSSTSRAEVAAALFLAMVLGAPYFHTHYLLWVLPGLLLGSNRFLMVLAGPFILLMPFMQILRVSEIGMSTAFRLTVSLHLLAVVCWIAYGLMYQARAHD